MVVVGNSIRPQSMVLNNSRITKTYLPLPLRFYRELVAVNSNAKNVVSLVTLYSPLNRCVKTTVSL